MTATLPVKESNSDITFPPTQAGNREEQIAVNALVCYTTQLTKMPFVYQLLDENVSQERIVDVRV